jgi:16S rRNA (uracil1498-N3)-methyltransferase
MKHRDRLAPSDRPRSGARFHVDRPLGPGAEVALPPAAAHHAARVLRLGEGDAVTLFDGQGGECLGVVMRLDRSGVHVRIAGFDPVERESPLRVTLVQGVSSGDRMDYTIRKAVELGVAAVVPVFTERGIVRLAGERAERRREHWQALATAACEQCGRNRIPSVSEPVPYPEWVAALGAAGPDEIRVTLSPEATLRLAALPGRKSSVILLAGPEGGLSDVEAQVARTRGFVGARLGPRILRTETAAVAALAVLQAMWGDF